MSSPEHAAPFGHRSGGVGLIGMGDDRRIEGRVQRQRSCLDHEDVVAVRAEVSPPLVIEQARLPVRRTDPDKHRVRQRREARHDGAIDFEIRRGARLVSPKCALVKDRQQDRPTASLAETVGRDRDLDVVGELDAEPRLARQHRPQVGDVAEESLRVAEDDPALVAIDGDALDRRLLAGTQAAEVRLLDRGGVGREQRGYAVLAGAASGNDPEFADAMFRWRSSAGELREGGELLRRHREGVGGFQDRAPGRPRRAREPRAEGLWVVHGVDD